MRGMNPIQITSLLPVEPSRERTVRAIAETEVERALQEGGRLRPEWLDRFANWWAAVTRELRPGAAVDPGPRRAAGER